MLLFSLIVTFRVTMVSFTPTHKKKDTAFEKKSMVKGNNLGIPSKNGYQACLVSLLRRDTKIVTLKRKSLTFSFQT